MKESRQLWDRFEKSGKLRDYIDFCIKRRQEKNLRTDGRRDDEADQSSL